MWCDDRVHDLLDGDNLHLYIATQIYNLISYIFVEWVEVVKEKTHFPPPKGPAQSQILRFCVKFGVVGRSYGVKLFPEGSFNACLHSYPFHAFIMISTTATLRLVQLR